MEYPTRLNRHIAQLIFYNQVDLIQGVKGVTFHYDEETQTIYMTGTNDLQDWWVNLNFTCRCTAYGEFHEGFYRAALYVESKIPPETKQIVGYSLGGAVAIICGHFKQLPVISFAAPNIGHAFSGLQVEGVNYRLPWDVVNFLPPWWSKPIKTITLGDEFVCNPHRLESIQKKLAHG